MSQPYTLNEVLQDYLPAAHIKPNTVELLQFAWKHLLRIVGNLPITEFNQVKAEQFKTGLLADNYTPTTVNIWIKASRPVTRWAYKRGFVGFDAWQDCKLLKISHDEIRIFRPDEIQRILIVCPDERRRLMAMLGLSSLRISEVLNLLWDDLDFENMRIKIQRHEDTDITWKWEAKDSDYGILPLYEKVASQLLCKVKPELPVGQPYICLSPQLYLERLWQRRNGKWKPRWNTCPETSYAKAFRQIFARANVQGGTFHSFRATAITQWLNSGMPAAKVQKLARHSSLETTMGFYYGANLAEISDEARCYNTF